MNSLPPWTESERSSVPAQLFKGYIRASASSRSQPSPLPASQGGDKEHARLCV